MERQLEEPERKKKSRCLLICAQNACLCFLQVVRIILFYRLTLLKQYNQRTREACSLAADFLTSPQNVRRSSQTDAPPVGSNTLLSSAPPHPRRSSFATVTELGS